MTVPRYIIQQIESQIDFSKVQQFRMCYEPYFENTVIVYMNDDKWHSNEKYINARNKKDMEAAYYELCRRFAIFKGELG